MNSILLIAGVDPSGNAGLFKDIQICRSLKKNFIPFPTALTFQTDAKYFGTHVSPTGELQKIWKSLDAKSIHAVKIGMLAHHQIIRYLVPRLKKLKANNKELKIVWDPVFYSSSGGKLLSVKGQKLAIKKLLPIVDIITPNAVEACQLVGRPFMPDLDPKILCHKFYDQFGCTLALKGGHLKAQSIDYFFDGNYLKSMTTKKSRQKIRGTGCTYSTYLACQLAHGQSPLNAFVKTKKFMGELFKDK